MPSRVQNDCSFAIHQGIKIFITVQIGLGSISIENWIEGAAKHKVINTRYFHILQRFVERRLKMDLDKTVEVTIDIGD